MTKQELIDLQSEFVDHEVSIMVHLFLAGVVFLIGVGILAWFWLSFLEVL